MSLPRDLGGEELGILAEVAQHFGWTRQQLEERLFRSR